MRLFFLIENKAEPTADAVGSVPARRENLTGLQTQYAERVGGQCVLEVRRHIR